MNSFIPWIGGKKLLRKEIIKRFPKEDFTKYVEVFGGAGWVLFAVGLILDMFGWDHVFTFLAGISLLVVFLLITMIEPIQKTDSVPNNN